MTPAVLTSVTIYLVTALGALLWVRRRGLNQRLRLLALLVGLMPLLQAVTLLKDNGHWFANLNLPLGDIAPLLLGALCVCAVYLLDLEISDRRKTDMRLRLVEQETPFHTPPPVSARVRYSGRPV